MRCELCPGDHNCIQPSGPECNGYTEDNLFIGEAPGTNEDKAGIPFIGKTGREVDGQYLPLAGLTRRNSRFTNAIRCLPSTPGHKLDPKDKRHIALLESCAKAFLYPEIERTRPKLLVPMGAFACKTIDPDISLDLHHGIPVATKWGTAFPMYHPAQGIHEPKKMLIIRTDWIRLKEYLAGVLQVPVDPYTNPDYSEVKDEGEIECINPNDDMAMDTETSRSIGPYCITYSQMPGTGRLIRASRVDLLARLQTVLNRWKSGKRRRRIGRIYWHNWMYDWKVTDQLGLQFPHDCIRDTMIQSFHLGNLPQGLKALAYRELGMDMEDFEDLVLPYSKPHVLTYYRDAYAIDWPKPDPVDVRDKDGNWKVYKAQGMNTKFKRFFTDLEKNPDKDVFKMWKENWEESQSVIEAELGPWPGPDIAHVPFYNVLHYACRDADATIRLKSLLGRMRKQVRKKSQELWRVQ